MFITFVLPAVAEVPVGGYAVVYTYANHLVARGHHVEIQHLPSRVPGWIRFGARRLGPIDRPGASAALVPWFSIDERIGFRAVRRLDERTCREADAVVATAWETALPVARLQLGARRSFYLIQHLETFSAPESEVDASWRLPLTKIVVSSWLANHAKRIGALPAYIVPNAVDTDVFRMNIHPSQRESNRVLMMGHVQPWKGTSDGLEAYAAALKVLPSLKLDIFSAYPRPARLPRDVSWHHNLPREAIVDLYNRAAIYMSPSHSEGWGLTLMEAMSCGCALLTTDIPGVRDYAREDNSKLVPARVPARMAESLVALVGDDSSRIQMALRGHAAVVSEYSWDRSVDRLETILASGGLPE